MNPILEANGRAWLRYHESQAMETHQEDFDAGWDAALEFTAPLIEAALATWRSIDAASFKDVPVEVVALGGAGRTAMKAAETWLAVVKPEQGGQG